MRPTELHGGASAQGTGTSPGFPRWPLSKAEEVRLAQGDDVPGWSEGEGPEAGRESQIREVKFSSSVISG